MRARFSVFTRLNPYGHGIERDRKRRNPIPRGIVFVPPLVQLAPEALRLVALLKATDPELAKRLDAYLWAENAIQNVADSKAVAEDIVTRLEAENSFHQDAADRLDPLVRDLIERQHSLEIAYEDVASVLPIKSRLQEATFDFGDHEPKSLAVIAADLGRKPPTKLKRSPKLWIILGNGAVLAFGFGVIADCFDAKNVGLHPWEFLGLLLMGCGLIYAACHLLETLGEWLGEQAPIRSTVLWVLAGCFFIMFVGAESTTERTGIYQALLLKAGQLPPAVSSLDIGWICALVVVPTLGTSFVQSLRQGALNDNEGYLVREQERLRQLIRQDVSEYRKAAKLHAAYRVVSALREQLEGELNKHRSAIRFDLTEQELRRKEDAEMDSHGYSERVETALDLQPAERPGSEIRWRRARPWWQSLWRLFRPRRRQS